MNKYMFITHIAVENETHWEKKKTKNEEKHRNHKTLIFPANAEEKD